MCASVICRASVRLRGWCWKTRRLTISSNRTVSLLHGIRVDSCAAFSQVTAQHLLFFLSFRVSYRVTRTRAVTSTTTEYSHHCTQRVRTRSRNMFPPWSSQSKFSYQVKSIHKQQTTIRKPIECAPEASRGGREWAEMTEGFHLEVTRHTGSRCILLLRGHVGQHL